MGKSAEEVLEILKQLESLSNNDIDTINEILKLENEKYNSEILDILEKLYIDNKDDKALYVLKLMSKHGYISATKKLEKIHNKLLEEKKHNNLDFKEQNRLEKFLLFDICNKLKDKGYIDNFNLTINEQKDKLNFDYLKIDNSTKIPLIAIEFKKLRMDNKQVEKNSFKECIEKIKELKKIYKNVKHLECFLIFIYSENYKIYKVYENGDKEEKNIDDILNLTFKEKIISSFIDEEKNNYKKIKEISSLFVLVILIVYFFFSIFPDILSNYIKWLLIMIGIMYGLLIFPYVKEVNFWGLQIKNFDMDK